VQSFQPAPPGDGGPRRRTWGGLRPSVLAGGACPWSGSPRTA